MPDKKCITQRIEKAVNDYGFKAVKTIYNIGRDDSKIEIKMLKDEIKRLKKQLEDGEKI